MAKTSRMSLAPLRPSFLTHADRPLREGQELDLLLGPPVQEAGEGSLAGQEASWYDRRGHSVNSLQKGAASV